MIKPFYLLAIIILSFLTSDIRLLSILILSQIVVWFTSDFGFKELIKFIGKFFVFFIFIILSYILFPSETELLPKLPHDLYHSFIKGISMFLRVFIIVLTSLLIRKTDEKGEFIMFLSKIGAPQIVILAVNSALRMLDTKKNAHKNHKKTTRKLNFPNIKNFLKNNYNILQNLINNTLQNSRIKINEEYKEKYNPQLLYDVSIISGITVLMMSTKLLKILPNIPIMPGHKSLIILPLYFLATVLTKSKWGGTYAGMSIGLVAFLFGEGTFGILEIFKYIAPGILIDLFFFLKIRPSIVVYSFIGLLMAWARLTTLILVAIIASAPPVFYAFLLPVALAHSVFGILCGPVAYFMVKNFPQTNSAS